MKKLRIGIDIDGILADFNRPYVKLLESIQSVRFPEISQTYPDQWDYDKARGVLGKHRTEAWTKIKESNDFWQTLPPLDGSWVLLDYLSALPDSADIYFITSRPGLTSKVQTEIWLREHGFDFLGLDVTPTVLISSQKGMCARALELDFYLDDKNENCIDVITYSPTTKCVMLAQPWNQKQEGIDRVDSLSKFIEILEKAQN